MKLHKPNHVFFISLLSLIVGFSFLFAAKIYFLKGSVLSATQENYHNPFDLSTQSYQNPFDLAKK